jgi:hypothetical protein
VKNGLRHRKFPINCAPLVCSQGKRLLLLLQNTYFTCRPKRKHFSFWSLARTQDVAFLRNSFNKFRQAENILRPFLFSFVSGRAAVAAAVLRAYNGRCQYTYNCDRQADVGQVRREEGPISELTQHPNTFFSLACGHLALSRSSYSISPCKRSSRFTPSLALGQVV